MSKSEAMLGIGRLVGILTSMFWSGILIASIFTGDEPVTDEGIVLFILIVSATLGVAVSLLKPKFGAYIILILAIALAGFAMLSAGHNHWLAVIIAAGPFLVSGSLILASKET